MDALNSLWALISGFLNGLMGWLSDLVNSILNIQITPPAV